MEKVIYDEKNGLWYELQGDYYIPCLKVPEQEEKPIGVWGQLRLQHLKQHHKILYTNLLISGKLNDHLVETDEQAEDISCRELLQQPSGASRRTVNLRRHRRRGAWRTACCRSWR